MNRRLLLYLMTFLLVMSSFVGSGQASVHTIGKAVDQKLSGSNVSVSVRSLDTGDIVYEKSGDIGIKPASTLKLLTASAALETLGEDYYFSTQMLMDGTIVNGVLNGNIYLRGEGDPTLQNKDFVTFGNTLKRYGIKKINGDLIGDESWFDGERLTPGIGKQDESFYYAAPVSALTLSPNNDYDASTVIVTAKGARVGHAPAIHFEPNASGLRLINRAKTVAKGQRNTVSIRRTYNTNQVVISGNMPIGSSKKEWVTLFNPTLSTLYSFKNTLVSQGIQFDKTSTVNYGKASPQAKSLGTKRSMTLKELMVPYMKLSNNSIADILVKTMGQRVHGKGTREAGIQVMRNFGEELGLDLSAVSFEDGSGISHNNKVPANTQTLLLLTIRDKAWYDSLLHSMPIAGQKNRLVGGTLNSRLGHTLTKNKVFAKTGTINNVNALAGYLQASSGNWYTFSILTQDHKGSVSNAIDELVLMLAKEL